MQKIAIECIEEWSTNTLTHVYVCEKGWNDDCTCREEKKKMMSESDLFNHLEEKNKRRWIKMNEWNLVETPPEEPGQYLVTDGDRMMEAHWNGENWRPNLPFYHDYKIEPSHWMLLPALPVKKHHCEYDADLKLAAFTDQNGTMFFHTYNRHGRHVLIEIKYCPFCGEASEA